MKPLHSFFASATLVCGLAMPATALELGVSAGGTGASVSIGGGSGNTTVSANVGGSGGSVSVGGGSGGNSPSDPSNPTLAGADGGDPGRINQTPPAAVGAIVGTAVWTLDNVLIGVVTSHQPVDRAGMVIIDVQTADEFGLSRDRVQLQIRRSAFQDGQLRLSHNRNRLLQLLS